MMPPTDLLRVASSWAQRIVTEKGYCWCEGLVVNGVAF